MQTPQQEGGAGLVDVDLVFPSGLVDICATWGVMAAVGMVIGQGFGRALEKGSVDVLACCWAGTASALVVLVALAFCWTL